MASQEYAETFEALRNMRALRFAMRRRQMLPYLLLPITIFVIAGIAGTPPGAGWHGAPLGISLAITGLGAGVLGAGVWLALTWRMRARRPAGLFAAMPVLIAVSAGVLDLLQPRGPGQVGLYLGLALAMRMLSWRQGAVFFGVCLAYVIARLQLVSCLGLTGLYLLSTFGLRIREQDEQTDRLLTELDEHRGAELRAAALAERQRLARDMHDVLAHSLSGLLLQLEGARLLATATSADPKLTGAIERAHALAKDGLTEARQAIRMLREGDLELPGPDALAALTTAFSADTGIPGEFSAAGEARELTPEVRLALYRVTQEGLTNVRKHAVAPGKIDVRLEYLPAEVTLAVEDQATDAPAAQSATSGYGLTGMRERAELLGGTLTAAPTGHGFRVELRVPA